MRKIVVFLFLCFFCLIPAGLAQALTVDIPTIPPIKKVSKPSAVIFSDASYSTATNVFSAGQTIYIKAETEISGSSRRDVSILDSSKKEVSKFQLQIASGYFFASFPAPSEEGTFYIDIKIEGNGGNWAYQSNIAVGKTSSSSVSTSSKSVSSSNYSVSLPSMGIVEATPTHGPTIMPVAAPAKQADATFLGSLRRFFARFLNFLTNRL